MDQSINIRRMKQQEKKKVREIMKKSFPFLARIFFTISPHTFVAEKEGELLGGVVLKLFPLKEGQGGLISWIFIHPKAQKKGIGQSLLDYALDFFLSEGVIRSFACIEGYNSSSQNLFQGRGFSRFPPLEMIKTFGLQTPLIWYHCQHMMDIGHFLWVKPDRPGDREGQTVEWWGSLCFNSLILLLALGRLGNLQLQHLYQVPLAFLLFLSVRDGAMLLVGKKYGIPLQYRSWESGFFLTGGLALALGGFFPVPGSRYPKEPTWKYREYLPFIGYMGLSGSLAVILTTIALGLVQKSTQLPLRIQDGMAVFFFIGQWFAIMDTLPILFPLSSFNGRRVWDLNRVLWGLLVLLVIFTFLL